VRRGSTYVALRVLLAVCAAATPAGGAEMADPAGAARPCETAIPPPPLAIVAQSRVHDMRITTPTQFDYTLASLTLNGPATGLRVTTTGPTGLDYVAAAAQCSAPRHIFVLVVNRQPRGSHVQAPKSVNLRIETQATETTPELAQHVDVLSYGAAGQDCSALTYYPEFGHPYLWGYQLKPLAGPSEPLIVSGRVASALNRACSDSIDAQFERWVRQEPPGVVQP
jgi:hypothetical protein